MLTAHRYSLSSRLSKYRKQLRSPEEELTAEYARVCDRLRRRPGRKKQEPEQCFIQAIPNPGRDKDAEELRAISKIQERQKTARVMYNLVDKWSETTYGYRLSLEDVKEITELRAWLKLRVAWAKSRYDVDEADLAHDSLERIPNVNPAGKIRTIQTRINKINDLKDALDNMRLLLDRTHRENEELRNQLKNIIR